MECTALELGGFKSVLGVVPRIVTHCTCLYLVEGLEYCVYCEWREQAVFISKLWSERQGATVIVEVYADSDYRRLYPEDHIEIGFFSKQKLVETLHIASRGEVSALRCLWETRKSRTCRTRAGRVG